MSGQDETLRLVAEVVNKWSGPLRDMRRDLQSMARHVKDTHAQGAKSAKEHTDSFHHLRRAADSVKDAVTEGVRPAMVAFGVTSLTVAGAVAAVSAAVKDFSGSSRDLKFASRELGFTINQLRELDALSKRIGSSPDAMRGGLATFANHMEQLRRHRGTLQQFFVSQHDLNVRTFGEELSHVRDNAQALDRTLQFLDRIHDPQQRRNFLSALGLDPNLARLSAAELAAALKDIRKDIGDLSDAAVDKGLKAQKAFDRLGDSIKRLKEEIGVDFAPKIADAADAVRKFLEIGTNSGGIITGRFTGAAAGPGRVRAKTWREAWENATRGGPLESAATSDAATRRGPITLNEVRGAFGLQALKEGVKEGAAEGVKSGMQQWYDSLGGWAPISYQPGAGPGAGLGGGAGARYRQYGGGRFKMFGPGGPGNAIRTRLGPSDQPAAAVAGTDSTQTPASGGAPYSYSFGDSIAGGQMRAGPAGGSGSTANNDSGYAVVGAAAKQLAPRLDAFLSDPAWVAARRSSGVFLSALQNDPAQLAQVQSMYRRLRAAGIPVRVAGVRAGDNVSASSAAATNQAAAAAFGRDFLGISGLPGRGIHPDPGALRRAIAGGANPTPAAIAQVRTALGNLYAPVSGTSLGGGVGGTSASMGAHRHQGDDIMAPLGSPIYAIKDGVIERIGTDNWGTPAVTIRHADGTYTRYLHLGRVGVQAGDEVKGGQVIGASGQANGVPHLHFEMWRGAPNRGGTLLNPRQIYGWDSHNLPRGGALLDNARGAGVVGAGETTVHGDAAVRIDLPRVGRAIAGAGSIFKSVDLNRGSAMPLASQEH